MNRRLLPFAFAFAPAVFAYACSSSDDGGGGGGTDIDAAPIETGPGTDTSTAPDGSPVDGAKIDSSDAGTSPIEGILPPVSVAALKGVNTEGPQWFGDGLYFSDAIPGSNFIKFTPPTDTVQIYIAPAENVVLGTALDESKTPETFVTIEASGANGTKGATILRIPTTGAAPRIPTPLVMNFVDAGGNMFDSPNDLVVRKADGTIYLTDPGYQARFNGAAVTINHIWRLKPTAVPNTFDVFEIALAGEPNGIALSPDSKTLYVSLTAPLGAQPAPQVLKYTVAADGALTAAGKFDVPPGGAIGVNSTADGIAVDTAGNIYVAVRDGVDVFKADGSGAKWGHITTPRKISGLAFGGADKKTLYMTTSPEGAVNPGLFSVTVKVAGLNQ